MAERGRPPKGVARSNILLRMPTNLIEQVDTFKERLEAERGGFVINRTDMLIRLIEVGLQTLTQARPPAPAQRTNGQGAPAPQPPTQPAIPLALEPAPASAHPVDVPQGAEKTLPKAATGMQNCGAGRNHPPYSIKKSECPKCRKARNQRDHRSREKVQGEGQAV
jgi:hypothetical protein